MAERIARIEDIEELTHINDLLIKEIERRAQPVPFDPETGEPTKFDEVEIARTQDEDEYVKLLRSMRSQNGFLAPGESFKARLKEDWNTVLHVLHTTHIEIATHLKNLLNLCSNNRSVKNVQYITESVAHNSFKQQTSQFFDISHFALRGFQYNLFANLEKDEQESSWNDEYLVRNCQLGIEIRVGGNLNHGVISFIESFGFYEGESVPDPMRLAALLSGTWNKQALEYEIATEKNKHHNIKQQIQIASVRIEQLTQDLKAKNLELANLKSKNNNLDDEQLSYLEYEKEVLEGDLLYLKNVMKEQIAADVKSESRLKELLQIIV